MTGATMPEPLAHRQPVTIALPVADRRTTFTFYTEGLGFDPLGDPADDGVPEPLQFTLNDGVRVMFIPTGGFGWVTGNRETATSAHNDCLLVLTLAGESDVHDLVDRARKAGAEIVMEPADQPWGFTAVLADPDGHLWQLRVAAPAPVTHERPDPEWKYVDIRRLLVFLEHSIDEGLQWVVFEPNDEPLWSRVRSSVSEFLLTQWRAGMLKGDKPEDAYFVRCGRDTMTQNDLDNGRLIAVIGVATVKPAEFVIFQIGQWTAALPLC